MVFHWNLSDNKSPQVLMTLLSILVDSNNVVVWMGSVRHGSSSDFQTIHFPDQAFEDRSKWSNLVSPSP